MGEKVETEGNAGATEALPKRHDVHANPAEPKVQDVPVPEGVAKRPVSQKSPAEWAYERIILYIKKFEETLDAEHEVAMGFTGGDAGVMRIEGMGYFDPDIVTFYGSDPTGAKTQIIQHVTQLNVMMRALPKAVQAEAPQRIGFRLAEDLEKV